MPINFKDLSGKKYGKWFVVCRSKNKGNGGNKTYWVCICDCGKIKDVLSYKLISKKSCSCGKHKGIHGHSQTISRQRLASKTYNTWLGMRQRCLNIHSVGYKYYGAKGISVCEEWDVFENFLKDMGEKPIGMSIDRIDVNGNYNKKNCRWASATQQAFNRRDTILINVDGTQLTINDISKKYGIDKNILRGRIIKHGWSLERAITQPIRLLMSKGERK